MNHPLAREVYLTGFGSFLPGSPVKNNEITDYLGEINEADTKALRRYLPFNGIKERYYALEKGGAPTFLTEEMAEQACLKAMEDAGIQPDQVDCLAAGTTLSDLLLPNLCQMLHGRLGQHGVGGLKTLPTAGVCLAGITALDNAILQIRAAGKNCAVVAAAERPSMLLTARHFLNESDHRIDIRRQNPSYSFLTGSGLRAMLSDAAGAVVVQPEPHPEMPSLRVDFLDVTSYAHELPVCMWAGTNVNSDIKVSDVWASQSDLTEVGKKGMLLVRQDTRLLVDNIASFGLVELQKHIRRGDIDPDSVDVFLPHISSFFFKNIILRHFEDSGINLPEEKWFTNLESKGNTGSAAIFVIMEEAIRSGRIKRGDTVLAMIPESARFAYGYMLMTCV